MTVPFPLNQPSIAALIHESQDLANKWFEHHPASERTVFNRMQRMRSLEFAQQEAAKLMAVMVQILTGLKS